MAQPQIPAPYDPGLTPPPGVEPYFLSPFTLHPYYVETSALCIIFITIMVAMRIYTKAFVIKSVTLEDYSCIVGWAAFIAFMGMDYAIGKHGGGTHQWNVYYKDVQYHKRLTNYSDMVYSVSLLSTKLSIMLLIKRVFCSVRRDVAYWLTTLLIFLNTGFYIAFLIVPIFLCSPRIKIWTPEVPGRCLGIFKLYMASAIFNLSSDVVMLSIPIYLVWQLKMSIRRKLGISAIFFAGGLACIASLLRLIYNIQLIRTDDYTYTHEETNLWATAEIAFGLICSCLVILPRLYQHFCDITPYKTHETSGISDARNHEYRDGKTKREWVQLEAQASEDRKTFSSKGRLGDERALDAAVEDNV